VRRVHITLAEKDWRNGKETMVRRTYVVDGLPKKLQLVPRHGANLQNYSSIYDLAANSGKLHQPYTKSKTWQRDESVKIPCEENNRKESV
jgi:hypothetical protein